MPALTTGTEAVIRKKTMVEFHKNADLAFHGTRCGTSLVEVMLTVVVIAILAIIATNALFYPSRMVSSDARRQVALHQASLNMELAAASYADASNTTDTITALNQTLTIKRNVELIDDIKQITVNVTGETGDSIVTLFTETAH